MYTVLAVALFANSIATVEEVVAVHFTAIQDEDRAALLSAWDEASTHFSSL